MKNKALLLLFALVMSVAASSVFAANKKNPVLISKKDTTQTNVVCYEVFGMDCPGCQSALEKQVKKIDGVVDAKASFKEKQVVIEMKPGATVSEEEIEKRIKKANFTPGKKIKAAKDEE